MRVASGWLWALALTASSAVVAQEACKETDSFTGCYNRIYEAETRAAGPEATAANESEQKKELANAQTGANSAGAATASTLTDLVPLFDALGLLSNQNDDGTLTFDLNFLTPTQDNADKNTQMKLTVNPSPEPLTQLVDAFPETVRSARKDELQKKIRAIGDAQLAVSYSLVNERFGRDYRRHRDELAPIYQGAVEHALAAGDVAGSKGAFELKLKKLQDDLQSRSQPLNGADRLSFQDLKTQRGVSDAMIAELMAAAADAAHVKAAATLAIRNEFQRTLVGHAADLVSQQPQLLFTLSHDLRDELVGPEKTSATLTLELTKANIGAFFRGAGGVACKDPDVALGRSAYDKCVDRLREYLGEEGRNLETQGRLKISASYQRVESATYAFPADNLLLKLPQTDRLEASVAYGFPLSSVKNADRIDFEATYDSNINNDTTNKDRLKASVTYTRHVGEMDVPFSVVYANKSEFMGDVDHQISMHIGVKFKPPAAK